jgi:hypothetical protein
MQAAGNTLSTPLRMDSLRQIPTLAALSIGTIEAARCAARMGHPAVIRSFPMTVLFESPRNEVVIKFKNVSNDEKAEIETFLKAQPDVKELRHRKLTLDHAPGAGALGLILAQSDLVAVISSSIHAGGPICYTTVARLSGSSTATDRKG